MRKKVFMFAIILGILLIGFCVAGCLPNALGWGNEIIAVLKGALPILAALTGLVSVFIGFADIQDKKEAKKEEIEAQKEAENAE